MKSVSNMDDIVGKAMAEDEDEKKDIPEKSSVKKDVQVSMQTDGLDIKQVDKIQKMLDKAGITYRIEVKQERSSSPTTPTDK